MQLSMITVWVADPQALRDWYVEKLCARVVQQTPRFVQLAWQDGAATVAFHLGAPLEHPERVQLHLRVADVDAVYRDLAARGVTFDAPPADKPWRLRTASFSDPTGHGLELEMPIAAPGTRR